MEQAIKIIDNQNVEITISAALKRGEIEYHTIKLRAPVAADMEQLSQELVKAKHTDSVQKLIARISQPQITRAEYMRLGFDDLNIINTALDFFSAPPSAKSEIKAALAELGYLSEIAESEQQAQQS